MALVFLAALAMRVCWLSSQGLWHDEFYSLANLSGFDAYLLPGSDLRTREEPRPSAWYQESLERDRFWETLQRNVVHEGHPPIYTIAARATAWWGYPDPWSLRALSAAASLASVGMLVVLAQVVGGARLAAFAGILGAVSPFSVYFGNEARSYSLALLAISACFVAVARAVTERDLSKGSATLFVIGGGVAMYTHYYAGPPLVILGVVLMISCRKASLPRLCAAIGGPALIFVPWMPILASQLAAHAGSHWTEGALGPLESVVAAVRCVPFLLLGPAAGNSALCLLGGAVVVGALALSWREQLPRSRLRVGPAVLAFISANAAVVCALDLITDHHTVAVPRYSFGLWFPVTIAVASGMMRLWAKESLPMRASVVGILLCAVAVAGALGSGRIFPKQMIREVAGYVDEYGKGEDAILVVPSGPSLLGVAYYSRPSRVVMGGAPDEIASRLESCTGDLWVAVQRLGSRVDGTSAPLGFEGVRANPVRFSGFDLFRVDCVEHRR